MLLYYLAIDTLTGFMLNYGYTLSFSQPYKLVLTVLMLVSIAAKNHNYICFIFFLLTWLFLSLIFYLNGNADFFVSYRDYYKIITIQIYFYYFCTLLKKKYKEYRMFNNVFLLSTFVLILNIVAGKFGYGFRTYEHIDATTTKGFFYSGNELSVLLPCLYYYWLSKIKWSGIKMISVYIIALWLAMMVGTKTGLLFCFFISIIDFWFVRTTKKTKFLLPLYIILLIICVIYIFPKTDYYKIWESFFKGKNIEKSEKILSILLSGRLGRLIGLFDLWKMNISPVNILFGMGYISSCEIDPFEVLFFYGALFFFLTLSYYVRLILFSLKKRNMKLFYFNIVYLAVSFTAGHVWYATMTGLFYTFINASELFAFDKNRVVKI
jgi:hypothetical protein